MGRHIVRAFEGVDVRQRFRDGVIHRRLKIDTDVRIGIFVDRQGSRCVLNEYVQPTDADVGDLRKLFHDLRRDEMKSASPWGKLNLFLVPHIFSRQVEGWIKERSDDAPPPKEFKFEISDL